MQKLVPHLWFDKEAREAAEFYVSLFDDAVLYGTNILEDTPSGDSEMVTFRLEGLEFAAISAGPYFKFNPSVSLMVHCDTPEEVDEKWNALIAGGSALMPLDEYPFSKRYGWLQDRFGLSWQLMLSDNRQAGQKIVPNLLFSGESCGKTEEALRLYTEVFQHASIGFVSKYGEGEAQAAKAQVNFASFQLEDLDLSAMDNAFDVDYGFNEAFSFIVNCDSQQEIDYFWERLSAVPEAEQCGWIKDAYGLSWQIVPSRLEELMTTATPEQAKRIVQAFLQMKKFDIAKLEQAFLGEADMLVETLDPAGNLGKKPYPDESSGEKPHPAESTSKKPNPTENSGEKPHPADNFNDERPHITIEALIERPLEQVWHYYNTPEHIMAWNHASDDWETTSASIDLQPGGAFSYHMAAKDGSVGFDFGGVYDEVIPNRKITLTLGDDRQMEVSFHQQEQGVKVVVTFEAEQENSLEMQRNGWQAILDSFKRHTELD